MSFSGTPFPTFPTFPSTGFFGVQGAALGDLGPGLIRARRRIGDLVADVTVEERHSDRLTITQQPVEKTASITDHAYKEPPTVTIRAGWSASSQSAQGNPNYPADIYKQLLEYQDTVALLDVLTGKRKYENMLLAELEVYTDQDGEYALLAVMTFQKVILVETQVTDVPPNTQQKQPESTGSTVNRGTQNAKPNAQPNTQALNKSLANGSSIRRTTGTDQVAP